MRDQANKRFWQRAARLYAPFMKSSGPLYDEIARLCLPYLAEEMRVLELACGSGQLTFRLAESVRYWEATDFSERMIAAAQRRPVSPNLTFAVRDATSLPDPDGSFDAALIANALHIMPAPDRAVAEIRRILKPGGLLMAPTFIWGTGEREGIGPYLMAAAGFRVLHRWDAGTLADWTAQQGFTVLERKILGGGIRPLCCLIARRT